MTLKFTEIRLLAHLANPKNHPRGYNCHPGQVEIANYLLSRGLITYAYQGEGPIKQVILKITPKGRVELDIYETQRALEPKESAWPPPVFNPWIKK